MAFKFTKPTYSDVELDGVGALKPTLTVERRMRIKRLDLEDPDKLQDAITLMASCFEGHEEEVGNFLLDLEIEQLYRMQMFLMGGDKAIEQFDKAMRSLQKEKKNV